MSAPASPVEIKPRSVYLISCGEFADYCVEGVAATREAANAIAHALDGQDSRREYVVQKCEYWTSIEQWRSEQSETELDRQLRAARQAESEWRAKVQELEALKRTSHG